MILSVSGLASGYGAIPILHDIGFDVADGECVGIWGHNGMGKTTLLTTLLGYRAMTRGKITFAGKDVTRMPTHHRARSGMGLVPQGRQIFPALTVAENLRMGSAVSGGHRKGVTEEVLELFPRLKPLLQRTGGLLSGGEQQLLALARCLCGEPKVMMLDEPTEGIQPSINEEIVDTLMDLRRRKGLTLIVVEQRREFIAALSDRVLIMQKGTIAQEVRPRDLLAMEELH
ncbi:MAG TPA: ATP-binding cassette domain-containing protein [Shinella sp.]|jgi:urea ABC transporter ATP-binding protein UrtE|uniref:ABC transporter ATP-binding protein n=1 Tax=Shinella sp. TaxID=1870904 RepID=UPI0029ABF1C3|nr:ATP-binding cassette domain-containing protein [Shinella sp.]MDX3975521.1 ATP-binding cassette domain-containing protein [Shinella sp.]HEV7247539.1 ATP-binding cassette domain-containing protein [Shinella sp.]